MASDGPESKAVSQAPDQDGEGESAEQLTKFVSLILAKFVSGLDIYSVSYTLL